MDSRAARRRGVSRIATIAVSVLAGGALALAASLALVPGKAEAHFPYEHAAANMPSWFAESTESCSPVEKFYGNASALEWECFKHVGHPWPDRGLYCNATVDHSEPSGGYSGGWFCYVGDDRTPFPGYCLRRYEYFAYENGQIAESYDPGGWYIASRSDYVFSLGPCDPITYLRDYIWQGCERAKASLEKARKRLEQADGRKAKQKARKKLKAAKKRVQQWC